MRLLDHRKAMGPAVWLFLLYRNNTDEPEDPVWAPVLRLRPIRDSQAAEVLKVPVHTVRRWRRRLERVGMIKTSTCRGAGLKILVRHSGLPCNEPIVQVSQPESWPEMQTEIVQ